MANKTSPTMTNDEKLTAYRMNEASFPVPPVLTIHWTEGDWIAYVDMCGKWGKNPEPAPIECAGMTFMPTGEFDKASGQPLFRAVSG